MSIKNTVSSEVLKEAIVEAMIDLKAKDIVVIDLREVDGAVTDFFVVCHGDSNTHLRGIANSVQRGVLVNLDQKPWHKEGKESTEWVLLDFVDVVAHIFIKDAREFYNIEELWGDAPTELIEQK